MLGNIEELQREVEEVGFAFRPAVWSSLSSEQLAFSIGQPVALGSGTPVHEIAPKSVDEAPSNTYSGNYGFGEFPLHTDLATWHTPPRYLMLRCVVGASDVATTVVDPKPAIYAIGTAKLMRALMKPRRSVAGRIGLLSLARRVASEMIIRWDERYLVPASRAGEIYAAEFAERVRGLTASHPILAIPGDLLVVDNWRMLHGRTGVSEAGRGRRIERVYLKAIGT